MTNREEQTSTSKECCRDFPPVFECCGWLFKAEEARPVQKKNTGGK